MDASNLPSPVELGIPDDLAARWRDLMIRAFAAYQAEYARLDSLGNPNRRGCAFPRAPGRRSSPGSGRIMRSTAPVTSFHWRPAPIWLSCRRRGCGRKREAPRFPAPAGGPGGGGGHPRRTDQAVTATDAAQRRRIFLPGTSATGADGVSSARARPTFSRTLADAVGSRSTGKYRRGCPKPSPSPRRCPPANRYGSVDRRSAGCVSLCVEQSRHRELRDLNRHRTGHRHTPLIQAGFYLPPEVPVRPTPR